MNKSGAEFWSTEDFRFDGNRIKEIEVYFGSLPEGEGENDMRKLFFQMLVEKSGP